MAGDNFVWGSHVEGSWNNAANWDDTTTGQNPATRPPGSQDDVTIGPSAGGATFVISGTGQSASLTLDGSVDLTGQFSTGAFNANGTDELVSGAALAVSGDANVGGTLTVDQGASFSIAGNLGVEGNAATTLDDENALVVGGDVLLTGSTMIVSDGLTVDGSLTGDTSKLEIGGDSQFASIRSVNFRIFIDGGSTTVGTIYDTKPAGGGQGGGGTGYFTLTGASLTIGTVAPSNTYGYIFKETSSTLVVNNDDSKSYSDLTLANNSTMTAQNNFHAGNISIDKTSSITIAGDLFGLSKPRGTDDIAGSLSVQGDFSGLFTFYTIETGGSMTVAGNTTVSGGSDPNFQVSGTLTIKGTESQADFSAVDGGIVQLAGLFRAQDGGTGYDNLSADATSSLEIGTAGHAAKGAITIDAGQTVLLAEFAAPTIVDNGVILADGAFFQELKGTLAGSGQVQFASGSNLTLQAIAADSTNTIAMTGTSDVLTLSGGAGSYTGSGATLTGFDQSDAIEFNGTVTDARYANGFLVLSDDGTTVARFRVDASYAGDTFDTIQLSNGYTQIALGPMWASATSGNFATASNWSNDAVPGANDLVAISVPGTYTVSVTSDATVKSLDESATGATLAIADPGGTVSVSGDLTIDGALTVDASGAGGSTLTVGGTFDNAGTATFGNAAATAATTLSFGALDNAGTINASGGSAGLTFGFDADSTGTIKITSGALRLAGAANNISGKIGGPGTLILNGGATAMRQGALLTTTATSVGGTGTTLYIAENLAYAGSLIEGAAAAIRISAGDTLTLEGTSTLTGSIASTGTLRLAGGSATLRGATVTVGAFTIAGADLSLGSNLAYAGAFSFGGSGSQIDLGGHTLSLTGTTVLGGGEIVGKAGATDTLFVKGTAENLSRLTFSSWTKGTDHVTVNGTAGADRLIGSSQNDAMEGGTGNDVLSGGAGADWFTYHAGWGHDTITDFTAGSAAGHDTIQIDKTLFANYAELMAHTMDSGANAIITSGTNTITLDHVHKADLAAADFKFK